MAGIWGFRVATDYPSKPTGGLTVPSKILSITGLSAMDFQSDGRTSPQTPRIGAQRYQLIGSI
jgi:hypothetical protein